MKLNLRSARIRLEKVLDGEDDSLCRLALDIHRHPELSFQEHRTSELLSGYLSRSGFQVQKNLAGLETSFIARSIKGRSRPALGFLAEMDGLAQLGHACGHNLIGVSSMGAGIILRKAFPQLKGSVEVIGCPAEERGGGKVILSEQGAFDHLDFAMLIHPSNRTEIYKLSLALVEVELIFLGKAAHAAAAPEKGINALDAAILTFNRVNALREKLSGYARINGIITEGGKAPNIIPDRARAEFWVRDEKLDQALAHAGLVVAAAQASALAIGARLKATIRKDLAYAPFLPNRAAGSELRRIYQELGIKIEQGDERTEMGSTDLGNLSRIVPALHPTIAITNAALHSPEFAKASASGQGLQAMKEAILAMGMLGYRVMSDSGLRKKMKAEFKESGKSR